MGYVTWPGGGGQHLPPPPFARVRGQPPPTPGQGQRSTTSPLARVRDQPPPPSQGQRSTTSPLTRSEVNHPLPRPGTTSPLARVRGQPPPPPRPDIWALCMGREYASYWNAFLFKYDFNNVFKVYPCNSEINHLPLARVKGQPPPPDQGQRSTTPPPRPGTTSPLARVRGHPPPLPRPDIWALCILLECILDFNNVFKVYPCQSKFISDISHHIFWRFRSFLVM